MPLHIEPLFSLTETEYADREIVLDPATGATAVRRCPVLWSDTACTILFSKYARRAGVPGCPNGETDAEEIFDRLAHAWMIWAVKLGHIVAETGKLFRAECEAMLAQQVMAPNSPQWFNTGLELKYGIRGPAQGHWAIDQLDDAPVPRVIECEDAYTNPQISACFIQSVSDSLVGEGGIMDLFTREARLFKYGGGSGSNYSAIRGKGEPLAGGGTSSGLLSFLKVGDTSAGAIKSGGTTRRAARIITVDIDHPDIESFITWKASEERKIRVLQAAGYSGGMEGEAATSAQGQNANNSVRVTEAFMDAVRDDDVWNLTRRTDGSVSKVVRARDLWEQIAQAAWACADPGLQFHTTINDWHTCPEDGEMGAANPCGEYNWLDDTACNLASINLVRFLTSADGFDFERFRAAVRLCTIVLDVSVSMAGYPTKRIAERSRDYRTLGLGYANLGGLLMRMGIPYDSARGRDLCSEITSVMGARSWLTSAEIAAELAPFPRFYANRDHVLHVLTMHRDAADDAHIPSCHRDEWQDAIYAVQQHGARNAQCALLAPTGTIGLVMNCDTTGIEPAWSLVAFKSLAGGGSLTIPCEAAQAFLDSDETLSSSVQIQSDGSLLFRLIDPSEKAHAIDVLRCANDLSAEAHLGMMAAAQPFLCGAISKCVVGETLIATDRGIIPIADFYQGEEPDAFRAETLILAAEQGQQATADFYYGGEQPVLRLRLADGRTICGTPNHRVKVGAQESYDWKRLDEITPGDHVALRLGYETWANNEADLGSFVPSPMYGNQKRVEFPSTMSPKLARLLGYYIADGNMTAYSVRITKNNVPLLEEMNGLFSELFGVTGTIVADARSGVTSLIVNSKTLCEFFRWVGADGLSPVKVIPWAVLKSPKASVFAFVRGLWLDGYVSVRNRIVAISLASRRLIEQLQVIFDNAGVRTVIGKQVNKENGRDYPCLYLNGPSIQKFRDLVALDQAYKQDALDQLVASPSGRKVWSDIIPCYRERMRDAIREARATFDFRSVMDTRTAHVSRQTAQEIYDRFGVDELAPIFAHDIHFVQVRSIEDDYAEVYDFHVPETHAFLGNSIVNHNTVNLPESATVADVAATYLRAHELGLKAIAVYRDKCKATEVYSSGPATTGEPSPAATQPAPLRAADALEWGERRRPERGTDGSMGAGPSAVVRVAGDDWYLHTHTWNDGEPCEIFLTSNRQGSAVAGWSQVTAILASLALQYGCPVTELVEKLRYQRFDPADFRSTSPVDAVAQALARMFGELPEKRAQPSALELAPSVKSASTGETCSACGSADMRRSGACFVCGNCGTTSGCS